MPSISTLPEGLKAYIRHGVQIDPREGHEQAIGECPFCSRELKFHVNQETGQADCKGCGWSGNVSTFLRELWNTSGTEGLEHLAEERSISEEALIAWGVVKSPLTDEWLIPGYSHDGKLNQ